MIQLIKSVGHFISGFVEILKYKDVMGLFRRFKAPEIE